MTEQKSVFHRYRRVLSALGTLLIVVLIFWTVNSPAIVGVSASNRQLPVYCVQRDDKVVAMSFAAISFLLYYSSSVNSIALKRSRKLCSTPPVLKPGIVSRATAWMLLKMLFSMFGLP